MKVKTLIEKLSEFNPESRVWLSYNVDTAVIAPLETIKEANRKFSQGKIIILIPQWKCQ